MKVNSIWDQFTTIYERVEGIWSWLYRFSQKTGNLYQQKNWPSPEHASLGLLNQFPTRIKPCVRYKKLKNKLKWCAISPVQKVVSEPKQLSDISLVVEQSNDWSCNQSWPESNTNHASNRAIFSFLFIHSTGTLITTLVSCVKFIYILLS